MDAIDFAGSKTIDEINVFSLHDNYTVENTPTLTQTFSLYGLLAFDVQYWNGSSWTTIPAGSVTGNNKVWRQFIFSPITTSKIRVMINSVPDAWSRVVEIQAFGTSAGGEKVQWLVPDHLGTPRIVLDQTGGLASVKRHDYLPFGEELFAGTGGRTIAQGYAGDGVRQQFTSKERDAETGLDFFGARYYGSVQGRFTSVDPIGASLSRLIDPQRLNRYANVRNNPLKYYDPDGRDLKLAPGLKKANQDRLIKDAIKLYRKESGRAALEQLAKSDVKYILATGSLPSRIDLMAGGYRDTFGETKPDPSTFKGTIDQTGRTTSIERPGLVISITLDLQRRDDAQKASELGQQQEPASESTVFNHEIGHAQDKDNDLVKEQNKTEAEAENTADAFANKVKREKDTMSEADAETRVREILGLPPKQKKEKKEEKNE